jgi:predicted polyphosphate/ATP-dependent NAD kinase
MLQAILKWLGFPSANTMDKVEPTFTSLHTEDSLSELTKSKLKTLGETKFDVEFKSSDRKVEMIMRILAAQSEK